MSTGGVPHIPHAFTQGFVASAGARPAREVDVKKAAAKPRASDEVTLGHTNEDADVDRVDTLEFQGDQQRGSGQHARHEEPQQRVGRAGIPVHIVDGRIVDAKDDAPRVRRIDLAG